MWIDHRLHELIWESSANVHGYFLTPKAAGTSLRQALATLGPVLRRDLAETSHGPACQCKSPMCAQRRRHESYLLRSMRHRKGPWFIDFGSRPVTADELNSLPEGVQIIFPLRPTAERIASYMRYFLLVTQAADKSHILRTRRWAVTWNLSRRGGHPHVPRFSLDFNTVQNIEDLQHSAPAYRRSNGQFDSEAWLQVALHSLEHPFLYRDLVPDLIANPDTYSLRLKPIAVNELNEVMRRTFGIQLRRMNISQDQVSLQGNWADSLSVEQQVTKATAADSRTWEILQKWQSS